MSNSLKVVIFNSPPRLGKGEAAKHMISITNTVDCFYTAHHREFKDSLFKLVSSMYGITVEEFLVGYDLKHEYSETGWYKDYKQFGISSGLDRYCEDKIKHLSQRDSLIHMSENIIKPVFGEDAFGKALVESLPSTGIVFVSDGGFSEELKPILDKVGAENTLVVRIHRKGVGFDGDSRSYLKEDDFEEYNNLVMKDINNDSSLEEFLQEVEKVVCGWVNH